MQTVCDQIAAMARPYWQTRQNEVHVPIAYDFARRLLGCFPAADANVVLPAVLLHDVGWKMVPEEKQLAAFKPGGKDRETQRFHEVEGVRIAGEILYALAYDPEKTRMILSIIDGHDTRTHALCLEDQIVKDADKLWRFTPVGVAIDHRRFDIERDRYLDWLAEQIDGWFFTRAAKKMAREALEKARSGELSGA